MLKKNSRSNLKTIIEEGLSDLIDPGAGIDVMRMGLVRDLTVRGGNVSLTFRPSSTVCPMAFSLASAIKERIESIPEVGNVKIHVENFKRASELENLLVDEDTDEIP